MMRFLFPFFLFLLFVPVSAQDYTIETPKASKKGWRYDNTPFPSGIKVRTLDKKNVELSVDQLTLIQVWTVRGGGKPEHWGPLTDMATKFKPAGLQTISVNFENGLGGRAQRTMLQEFFKTTKKPEIFYYDSLGYITDFLKVAGFPTYFLVEPDGTIVFRTNGHDQEGVSILEQEIAKRVNK